MINKHDDYIRQMVRSVREATEELRQAVLMNTLYEQCPTCGGKTLLTYCSDQCLPPDTE